jgi:hypothetical protein
MIYRVYKKYGGMFPMELNVGYFSQLQFALEAVEGIKFANPNTEFKKVEDDYIWESEALCMRVVIEQIKLVA